ncbi:MAG: type II toxin-antitoxin system HicB family antitoxin [Gammaproteobacteria bacterium]|nr:type II toxin-antitoxin system HicB family antitoxin [Gammaproteobacteria bacterium]
MRYMAVVGEGTTSFGAYAPELPGCAVVGDTRDEVLTLIRKAIRLHLEGLREQGQPVPHPHSSSGT